MSDEEKPPLIEHQTVGFLVLSAAWLALLFYGFGWGRTSDKGFYGTIGLAVLFGYLTTIAVRLALVVVYGIRGKESPWEIEDLDEYPNITFRDRIAALWPDRWFARAGCFLLVVGSIHAFYKDHDTPPSYYFGLTFGALVLTALHEALIRWARRGKT